jgi:superoxide dismutase, Fe-Mn family
MKYQIQDYSHLTNIGKISNAAMELHFKLYAGYVNNINTIIEKLGQINLSGSVATNLQEYNELHRRFGWEFNGMRLHEIFFGNLKSEANSREYFETDEFTNLNLIKSIEAKWTSFENFKIEFYNIAKMRGFGWTMLLRDKRTGELVITWVNEHDVGLLADCDIVFTVDVLEHAYITDFGTDRLPYLDSIFEHLDFAKI